MKQVQSASTAAQDGPRRAPGPSAQGLACRCHANGGACATCQGGSRIGRSRADHGAPPTVPANTVGEMVHGSGRPLAVEARRVMERGFGHDFSSVRLHAGGRAQDSARALGAAAYTVGDQIVLGAEAPPLSTPAGRRLLAHELTHVVQNSRSVAGPSARPMSQAGDAAEREADTAADQVLSGRAVRVTAPATSSLQRLPAGAWAGIGAAAVGVGVGVGLGVAALMGKFSEKKEPGLDDPKFRAKWEAALQKGFDELEAGKQKNCAFPGRRTITHDDTTWEEDQKGLTGLLHGSRFRPRSGTPYEAVTSLFANLDKWVCDCRLFSELFQLYAWHEALADDQDAFNKRFAGLTLTAEGTTGMPREVEGSDLGADVPEDKWNAAPVGSKVVWRNESPEATEPWAFEHTVKRAMAQGDKPALYAAQGIGMLVSEDKVKQGLAEHCSDFPFTYEVTDAVVEKVRAGNATETQIQKVEALKGHREKTFKAFLALPGMQQLGGHYDRPVRETIEEFARTPPPIEEAKAYIATYIRRDKIEVLK